MTKCPYVPPHPWNVDFPHLMLRAKAAKFRKQGASLRDRMLTSTDRVGRLATIPVVAQIVNKANASARGAQGDGQGRWASRPPQPCRLRQRAVPRDGRALRWRCPVRDGARTPGKVAIFATCYVNYIEPGIGHDLLAILAHNEVPYTIVEKEACCGMPKLELGDLESVEKLKSVNIPTARRAGAIGSRDPHLRAVVHADVQARAAAHLPRRSGRQGVADAMFDPFEYLVLRDKDGLLRQATSRRRSAR